MAVLGEGGKGLGRFVSAAIKREKERYLLMGRKLFQAKVTVGAKLVLEYLCLLLYSEVLPQDREKA